MTHGRGKVEMLSGFESAALLQGGACLAPVNGAAQRQHPSGYGCALDMSISTQSCSLAHTPLGCEIN